MDTPVQDKFKVGNGIANIGNNCYMNAIVQILAHSTLFRLQLADSCAGELTESLKSVIREVYNQSISIVTPKELKQTLGRLNNLFQGNEQFDACEFT